MSYGTGHKAQILQMVKTINGIYRNLIELDVTFDIQRNCIECKSLDTFYILAKKDDIKITDDKLFKTYQATVDGIHIIYIKIKGE